jgi:hypothetical protein
VRIDETDSVCCISDIASCTLLLYIHIWTPWAYIVAM